MLPFNTTIPAVVVAVLGFSAGALVFNDLLSEPQLSRSVAEQDAQPAGLQPKPKQAAKTSSGSATKTSAANGQGPQG